MATDMTRTAGELIKGTRTDGQRADGRDVGLGPLEPLMKDPEISDILVNGPHSVYVERAAG